MKLSRRQIKESEAYKRLTHNREYRDPIGFTPWSKVAFKIASDMELAKARGGDYMPSFDFVQQMQLFYSARFVDKAAPAFWLGTELGEALWNTALPDALPPLPQVIPCGCLMLPDTDWLATSSGTRPQFLLFGHRQKGTSEAISGRWLDYVVETEAPRQDQLSFVSFVDGEVCWRGSPLDGGVLDLEPTDFDVEAGFITLAESEWSTRLMKLLYQCLLILSTQPDLADTATELPPTKGFGKTHRKLTRKERLLNPRWIGKPDFRVKRESQGGTHASPTTHWRRGHWRRTPVGPKDKGERKLNWIQPVIVNASVNNKEVAE